MTPARRLIPLLPILALFLTACPPQKKKTAPKAAPARSVPVDPAAQKRAYDQGVKAFGEERYKDAKKFWQDAARLGPGTPLGRKATENLSKVDSILKSLQEIEKQ